MSTLSAISSRWVLAASLRSRRMRSIARFARRGRQPGAWLRRRAIARPTLGRDRKRFLSCLLSEVEVTEEADQAREDAVPLVAKDLLEQP